MLVFILRRLSQSLIVAFVMSGIVFTGVYAIGNPVELYVRNDADQIERERAAEALGVNKPLHEQYGVFLKNIAQGDLGRSFVYNRPALDLIFEKMPATLELAFTAVILAIVLGLPLGLYAGYRPDSYLSTTIMAGSILGFSLPAFWVGLMLIMVFSVQLGWLPASGRGETGMLFGVRTSIVTLDGWAHIILPAINLALFKLALVIRLARAGMRENMLMDYVRFARAKGLSSRRIIFVHVLKNIMIPVVTVIGLELGSLIAFAVVTETVFAWPGMGKLIIDSIRMLDRPMVVAYLLITLGMFIVINLVVDILYSLLDPRVRLHESAR
jgi:peptide/nickel transport system permease protein